MKEKIIMSETLQHSVNQDKNVEPITLQDDSQPADISGDDSLAKVRIGAIVGTVLGVVIVTLGNKVTVESINNTVKSIGEVVKGTANSVNSNVRSVGDAVKNVADNVNYVVEDVGATVKGVVNDVNQNVKGIVNVVRDVYEGSNYNIAVTVDAVKSLTEDVSQNVKSTVDVAISDVVEQQQTTVASVHEQSRVAENEGAGMNWYQQLLEKDENSPDPKDWKQFVQALGKSEADINQIATLAESGQLLPEQVRAAMEQDFSAYKQISLELWQWHEAAKALGRNEAYLKQIAEMAIAFHHSEHSTPMPKKAFLTPPQNIEAYREKSKPAIESQATVVVPKEPTQQELIYRLHYQKLQERARQLPQLKNSSIKEVDIVVVIIALEESLSKNEIKGIITQSDQIKTWKQSMSEKEFKSKAVDYIREVCSNAINLRQNLLKQRKK